MSAFLTVNGETIPVRPDTAHEYVLETSLVAKGYGVSNEVIRNHKSRNSTELIEGKHWIKGVTNCYAPGGEQESTFWTKRGIIRLGFFIKSARAKLFRDAAEDLVIDAGKQAAADLNDPAFLRAALIGYTEKVLALQPKADALDLIATRSEGACCITTAAKTLQLAPKALFQWLQSNGWIYRRAGGKSWLGYQTKTQQGCLEHKVITVSTADGDKIHEQVLVTAKGLSVLAEHFTAPAVLPLTSGPCA